jgi:hypothetical protein
LHLLQKHVAGVWAQIGSGWHFSVYLFHLLLSKYFVMMITVQAKCERREEHLLIAHGKTSESLSRRGRVREIADCDRTGFFLPGKSKCDFAYGSNSKFSLHPTSSSVLYQTPLPLFMVVISAWYLGLPFPKLRRDVKIILTELLKARIY